jgi:hypothetical protein
LAFMLGENPDHIKLLEGKLPPWVVIMGIAGRDFLPSERVAFQEKDTREIVQQFGLQFVSAIPGARDSDVLEVLTNPSKEPYWKLRYKGGCQDIFFITTLNRTPEFVKTIYAVAESMKYPLSDIGIYIQPVHQGVACHCEFSLPYISDNAKEVKKVQDLFIKASEELLKQGAYFSRPYSDWANMAFNKDMQTTNILRKIKRIFDPNNIMNPGKLCFEK